MPIGLLGARVHLRIALAVFGLVLVLLAFAFLLVWLAGVDPLTAYLATSPGGADSVAIIAANSAVDVPFVMAMQAGRLLVVTLTGPALARYIATRFEQWGLEPCGDPVPGGAEGARGYGRGGLWHDQSFFYNLSQPARDHSSAASAPASSPNCESKVE